MRAVLIGGSDKFSGARDVFPYVESALREASGRRPCVPTVLITHEFFYFNVMNNYGDEWKRGKAQKAGGKLSKELEEHVERMVEIASQAIVLAFLATIKEQENGFIMNCTIIVNGGLVSPKIMVARKTVPPNSLDGNENNGRRCKSDANSDCRMKMLFLQREAKIRRIVFGGEKVFYTICREFYASFQPLNGIAGFHPSEFLDCLHIQSEDIALVRSYSNGMRVSFACNNPLATNEQALEEFRGRFPGVCHVLDFKDGQDFLKYTGDPGGGMYYHTPYAESRDKIAPANAPEGSYMPKMLIVCDSSSQRGVIPLKRGKIEDIEEKERHTVVTFDTG